MYEKIRVYFVISKKVTGKKVYINFVRLGRRKGIRNRVLIVRLLLNRSRSFRWQDPQVISILRLRVKS